MLRVRISDYTNRDNVFAGTLDDGQTVQVAVPAVVAVLVREELAHDGVSVQYVDLDQLL